MDENTKLTILARKSALWSIAVMHICMAPIVWKIATSDTPSEVQSRALDSLLFSIASLIGLLLFGKAALNLSNRFGTPQSDTRVEETSTTTKTVTAAPPATTPEPEKPHD